MTVLDALYEALLKSAGLHSDEIDPARFFSELESAGYRIVKSVEPGEASRPGFDKRSYEVGYMEGENSAAADRMVESC